MKTIRKTRISRKSERIYMAVCYLAGIADAVVYLATFSVLSSTFRQQVLAAEWADHFCD